MRTAALALAVLSCSGCFIEPQDRAAMPSDPFIAAELVAWRAGLSSPARLDRAARAVGATSYAELAALAVRDCLEPPDADRFAAARGLTSSDARVELRALGVRVCGR
jgi:hypothetical protein